MSHLENRRKYESEGLRDATDAIIQTRWIKKADVIWVRVRPEHTTDKERVVIEKHLQHLRDKIPIINDIAVRGNTDILFRTDGKPNVLPIPEEVKRRRPNKPLL